MSLVFWFVFTQIFVRSVGEPPYILFLLSGLLPFMWSSNWWRATRAIKDERRYAARRPAPRHMGSATGLAQVLRIRFALPVLAIFAVAYRAPAGWEVLLTVPAVAIQSILLTGLGFPHRPGRRCWSATSTGWCGSSCGFCSMRRRSSTGCRTWSNNEHIPSCCTLYALNPMTGIIALYRSGFFPISSSGQRCGRAWLVSLAIFAAGWWVFARLEHAVLKEI